MVMPFWQAAKKILLLFTFFTNRTQRERERCQKSSFKRALNHIILRPEREFLNTYKLIELKIKIIGHLIFFVFISAASQRFRCHQQLSHIKLRESLYCQFLYQYQCPSNTEATSEWDTRECINDFWEAKYHKIEINRFSTLFSSTSRLSGRQLEEEKKISSYIAKHSTIDSFFKLLWKKSNNSRTVERVKRAGYLCAKFENVYIKRKRIKTIEEYRLIDR